MTRRTLNIAIDANRVTCGKCTERIVGKKFSHCCVFHRLVHHVKREPQRCAPCLSAEVRE